MSMQAQQWPMSSVPTMPRPVQPWNQPTYTWSNPLGYMGQQMFYDDQMARSNPQPIPTVLTQQPPTPPQQQQVPDVAVIGRYVTDISEVVPKEVPMDGSRMFFPMKDESGIYMKYWDSGGTLREKRFVPEIEPNEVASVTPNSPVLTEETIAPLLAPINDRLATIEQVLLAALQAPVNTPPQPKARANQNSKKEES